MNPRDPALNYVVVQGVRSPGRADLTGCSRPHNWEVVPFFGMGGARTIYKGSSIAKPTLLVTLWEPEHFPAWEAFAKLLPPPTIGKPLAIGMSHPKLTAAEIKAVQVEDLGVPERQDSGVWLVTVKLIEYNPPAPALVTPRGSVPAVGPGAPIAPKTKGDEALADAMANVQRQVARARAAGGS